MFNVATKQISVIMTRLSSVALVAAFAIGTVSCGNSGKTSEEAEAMLEDASRLSQKGQYDSAVALLDSLCKTRPSETEAVKQAMHLKAQTLERSFVAQME